MAVESGEAHRRVQHTSQEETAARPLSDSWPHSEALSVSAAALYSADLWRLSRTALPALFLHWSHSEALSFSAAALYSADLWRLSRTALRALFLQ
ncbi:hypothetical protein Q8A67_025643 [Cirrhinus molitorella]|uniref:Uncharacterized protein n=1 Tax=Cirrhinus molitorella TaxID=172907 RepID=A0AA88NUV7_9TELE|nr:hypothetical protein Q8A67_025643 [Cirrhinus molitorella]